MLTQDFLIPYFETILQHISQGILFIDSKKIITTYNKAASELLGLKSCEVLFHSASKYFSDETFGFSIGDCLASQQCPKMTVMNWVNPHHGIIEIEVEPILIKTTDVQGILILLRNMTEIRRLQQIASRHDRLQDLGEMAARVAHEIRNPLGSIKGFASLLQDDLRNIPYLQKIANFIVEGTERLNELVSHILNYSRTPHVHFEQIDLIALIHEIIQQIQNDPLFHPGIHYTFNAKMGDENIKELNIFIDQGLMKSALFNLIINALESMPEGGDLQISIEQHQKEVIINISDTGIGIQKENLYKIFLPFFTTKIDGNGLGLSEVHKAIQAQHGTIEVTSQEGKGSCFKIRIPFTSPPTLSTESHITCL